MSVRDLLQESTNLQLACVKVPEWPGEPVVEVRELTLAKRLILEKETALRRRKDKSRVHAIERLVIATCHNVEDGSPMFKPEDEDWLAQKGSAGISRLFRVACKLNGYSDEDEEDLGNY